METSACASCLARAMMDVHCLRCPVLGDARLPPSYPLSPVNNPASQQSSQIYNQLNSTTMSVRDNLKDKESTVVGAASVVGAIASQIVPMINPTWGAIADALSAAFASLAGLYLAFRAKKGR